MDLQRTPFVLNCSRVGRQGGLKTFADEVMRSLLDEGWGCSAVVPAGYRVPTGAKPTYTPASLAGSSNLSLLRPMKWLAYSRFGFPVPKDQRVLCTTHHVLPGRSKQIVTVHDLRPYFLPDTPVQRFYFHHMLPRALNRCDGILTVSETSRQIIADVYSISLDRIAVVPNSIQPPPPYFEQRFPAERYLLAVGASWPHKNIAAVLAQHRLWADDYRFKVIAGKGQYREELEKMAHSLGVGHRLEFLSDVGTEALEELYAGCSALVYPSRMEGFGLPPLEAMARGCPVIVADIPVFRELYGSHALYVHTDSEASWQQAFADLATISPARMEAARIHAGNFTRLRLASALSEALHRFWSL